MMQALALYQELLRLEDPDPLYHTYSAACYYYMGQTQQAEEAAQQVSAHKSLHAGADCTWQQMQWCAGPWQQLQCCEAALNKVAASTAHTTGQLVKQPRHHWCACTSSRFQQSTVTAQHGYHTCSAVGLMLTAPVLHVTLQGPRCPLATRILFHCAHSRHDEDALMALHSNLSNSLEDQLSLAALHFNRGNYQVCQHTANPTEDAHGCTANRQMRSCAGVRCSRASCSGCGVQHPSGVVW